MRSGSHESAVLRLLTPGTGNRGPILAPGTLYPGMINRNCFCRGGRENRQCRQNQYRTNQRDDGEILSHIHSSRSNFSFLKGRRPGRERGFPIREVSPRIYILPFAGDYRWKL